MYERGSLPLTPSVQNVTLTTHDTEYSLTLSPGCEYFQFQCRTAAAIRFAFVAGKVAGSTAPFATLPSGGVFASPNKFRIKNATTSGQTGSGSQIIYFGAATTDGLIVELVEWTQ